jgi:hypothetical protein
VQYEFALVALLANLIGIVAVLYLIFPSATLEANE